MSPSQIPHVSRPPNRERQESIAEIARRGIEAEVRRLHESHS